jgi:hypothetical protein
LTLRDVLGNIVDQVSYTKYDGGNGNGMSLERTDRGWQESDEGGSPGAANKFVRPERHRCEDGTVWGNCSKIRPLYCRRGVLEPRCGECGCRRGQTCLQNGSCGAKTQENASKSVKNEEFVASSTTLAASTLADDEAATIIDDLAEEALETTTSTTIKLKPPAAVSAVGMPTGRAVESRSNRGVGALIVGLGVVLAGLIYRRNQPKA